MSPITSPAPAAPAAPAAPVTQAPAAPAPGAAPSGLFPSLRPQGPQAPVVGLATPVQPPGSDTPAPPAPAAPVAPAAPAAPAAPDARLQFFGGQPAQPAAPAAPAAPGAQQQPAPADFDPAAFATDFLSKVIPQNLIDPSQPAAKNFEALRNATAEATKRALAAEMKLVRAHQGGGTVAEQALKDKLAAAEARLNEVTPKIEKLSTLEARAELLDNEAFTQEYVDKLDQLKADVLQAVEAEGLDKGLVDRLFGAENKLAAAKLLAEVEDPETKAYLKDLAFQAIGTRDKLKAEWKDPVKALEGWRAKRAELGDQMSQQRGAQAVALHRQAVQAAMQGDPQAGVPGNFALAALLQSPEGVATINEIEAQYAGNKPIPQGQVFADRVQAATVPHLLNYTMHLEAQLEAMQKEVAQYRGLQPGSLASPGQQAMPQPPRSSGLWGFQAPPRGPVVQAVPVTQAAVPGMVTTATRG